MKVLSDLVTKTQSLIIGLKKNRNLVNDKGLDQQFISKLEEEINIINSLNKEIDALKAEAKVKSKEANLKAIDAKMQVKQAKRIIKQDFDPTQWKDFGIQDRR